jgi:hypothetical protein
VLQNATLLREKLCSVLQHGQCIKTPKSSVAFCDATQAFKETPSPAGQNHSLALTSQEEIKKERKEAAPFAPLTTPVSPDFKKFVDGSMEDQPLGILMNFMQSVWSEEEWLRELPHARSVMEDARCAGYNPYALFLHNHAHYPLKGKNSGLRLRSFAQWAKALSTSTRMLNNYLDCIKNPCDDCRKADYVSWSRDNPMLGVDAIHCACTPPRLVAIGYHCSACLMANKDMELKASPDRLRKDWQQAEIERWDKLTKYDFRQITHEDEQAFKAMRGADGWVAGRLKEMITPKVLSDQVTEPAVWDSKYAQAAILYFLDLGQAVSWEAFSAMVEQIRTLDAETPFPQ